MPRTTQADQARPILVLAMALGLFAATAALLVAGCRLSSGPAAPGTGGEDLIVAASERNFDELVLKSELPVLVDFYADWCPPCRQLHPNLGQVARAYPGTLKVVQVDVSRNRTLARRYGVSVIPTLLVIKHGQIVDRAVGYHSIEQLKALVGQHL